MLPVIIFTHTNGRSLISLLLLIISPEPLEAGWSQTRTIVYYYAHYFGACSAENEGSMELTWGDGALAANIKRRIECPPSRHTLRTDEHFTERRFGSVFMRDRICNVTTVPSRVELETIVR